MKPGTHVLVENPQEHDDTEPRINVRDVDVKPYMIYGSRDMMKSHIKIQPDET